MSKIVYNAIRTPDGTVLESKHGWDFKVHVDKNGLEYMVDGGLGYTRRYIQEIPYEELSVAIEDGHEAVREAATWGTYGINGDQPISYIKLKDMSTEHIENCLENVLHMHPNYREAFQNELKYRKERGYV